MPCHIPELELVCTLLLELLAALALSVLWAPTALLKALLPASLFVLQPSPALDVSVAGVELLGLPCILSACVVLEALP